jgi:hypothetical protein
MFVRILIVLPCARIDALRQVDTPVQGVMSIVNRLKKIGKEGQGPTIGCSAIHE